MFMFIFNQVLHSYSLSCVPFYTQLSHTSFILLFSLLKIDGNGRNSRVGKNLFLGLSLTTVPLKNCVFILVLQFSVIKFLTIHNPFDSVLFSSFFFFLRVEIGWFFYFVWGCRIRTEEHEYPENLGFRSYKRVSVFGWGSW